VGVGKGEGVGEVDGVRARGVGEVDGAKRRRGQGRGERWGARALGPHEMKEADGGGPLVRDADEGEGAIGDALLCRLQGVVEATRIAARGGDVGSAAAVRVGGGIRHARHETSPAGREPVPCRRKSKESENSRDGQVHTHTHTHTQCTVYSVQCAVIEWLRRVEQAVRAGRGMHLACAARARGWTDARRAAAQAQSASRSHAAAELAA
jgi:hypothetical protein